ncbi:hypothetical protein BS50DRAFT_347068 [Corynespora cassiicola Philippines]|uniref:Uncharacterized protein n=1 Tax=Corynespora cassiicola Philippines TaxID=1448308 RepID=A0A2T2NQG3_CORCC|nr:hypothetical protein BS50DRAFT_347068 [Corynespora cassiicola Philippines]
MADTNSHNSSESPDSSSTRENSSNRFVPAPEISPGYPDPEVIYEFGKDWIKHVKESWTNTSNQLPKPNFESKEFIVHVGLAKNLWANIVHRKLPHQDFISSLHAFYLLGTWDGREHIVNKVEAFAQDNEKIKELVEEERKKHKEEYEKF